MEAVLARHGTGDARDPQDKGYRGGRLEEVFLKLTSEK
jgi:hypothetical protein